MRVERLRFEVSGVRAEGEQQLVSRWSAHGGEVQGSPMLGSYVGRRGAGAGRAEGGTAWRQEEPAVWGERQGKRPTDR